MKCSKSLDIVGLSIDSSSDKIENELGRFPKIFYGTENGYSHINLIKNRVALVKSFNIKLKINSTITPLNWNEDINELILSINPFRWKVLEVHPIHGINDNFFKLYSKLEYWQFDLFKKRHSNLKPVYETTDMIIDSYCMITPDGRFFQDTNNQHHYSELILNTGVLNAFNQINHSVNKYNLRNGDYFKNLN